MFNDKKESNLDKILLGTYSLFFEIRSEFINDLSYCHE